MRDIYIINRESRSMNYGIGTYTEQLVEALKTMDFNINLVLLHAEITHFTIEAKENIRIIKIPKARQYTKTSYGEERYLRSSYYLLYPFISKENEPIFHFNFLNISELGKLLKENFKCKIVLAVHYMDWSFALLGNVQQLKEILINAESKLDEEIKKTFEEEQYCMEMLSDHIIAISNHSFQTIQSLYKISSTKITIVPNGLKDTFIEMTKKEKSELRKYFHLSPKEIVMIFAGRIDPVKGIDYLIEAFKLLLKKKDNIRLFIAGDGAISDLASKISPFWSKISFTGFLSKEELCKLYSIADVGVVPSIHEEFGLVAIEMLMHKIPVIVNKTTGLEEIVTAGSNGEYIIIDEKKRADTAAVFCDTILKLIENPRLRKKYIRQGRSIFLTKYSLSVFRKKINAFYSNI